MIPDAATRERAVRTLHRQIDEILQPAGYLHAGGRWDRATAFARTAVMIQRGKSGVACHLGIERYQRFLNWEWVPQGMVFSGWRLSDFADSVAEHNEIDALPYAELDGDSPLRRRVLALLRERVLPWLLRSHNPFGYMMLPPRIAAMRSGKT